MNVRKKIVGVLIFMGILVWQSFAIDTRLFILLWAVLSVFYLLSSDLDPLTQRVNRLTETVDDLTQRVDKLTYETHETVNDLAKLTERVDSTCRELDDLSSTVEPLRPLSSRLDSAVLRAASYKMELNIVPDWEALVEFAANQDGVTRDLLLTKIHSSPDWRNGYGLFGKSFHFVVFEDTVSAVRQVWSDYHKTFVDQELVEGRFTGGYGHEFFHRNMIFTPEIVGFVDWFTGIAGTPTDPWDVARDKASELPFDMILRLLLDIHRHSPYSHMCAIQQFPQEYRELPLVSDVAYENWARLIINSENFTGHPDNETEWFQKTGLQLYKQELQMHYFKTKFYSLGVNLTVFD